MISNHEELGDINISQFADGEIKVNIDESIRGDHVYLVQSTSYPVNDHLMELLIAIDALRCYQGMAYDDFDRTEGMPSQDLYNLITIDTHDKMVKLIRIGCDVDRYLRKRDTLCINYKTFEIIK